jgi:hypothetical protein
LLSSSGMVARLMLLVRLHHTRLLTTVHLASASPASLCCLLCYPFEPLNWLFVGVTTPV